jgi:hypothetical protein
VSRLEIAIENETSCKSCFDIIISRSRIGHVKTPLAAHHSHMKTISHIRKGYRDSLRSGSSSCWDSAPAHFNMESLTVDSKGVD